MIINNLIQKEMEFRIMDDGSRLPWIIAIILLGCAMYFAVTETAMASASRTKIKTAADRGDTRARSALFLLDNFDRAITTILIGTNIVHIAVASIVTVAVTRRWGLSVVTLSTIITTITVFFLGEMLPKSLGKKHSEKLLLSCAGPMRVLMKLFAPLSALLTMIGQGAAKLSRGDPEITVTEDELYDIIEDMTEEGSLDEEQGELISSALQFGDVTVESILTPRVDVTAVDVEDPLEDVLSLVRSQNHSRLPVYEGTIDNIIGILQIRKFIKAYLHLGANTEVRPLLDEPFFIHQSTNIDELLPIMSKGKKNMAVVTDNYGGTVGIVTIEDILEELVGEIWDEDDVVEEPIADLGGGVIRVDAEETVSDVFEHLSFEDPEEDEELVNTQMGEWAYEQFTAIPRVGDSFLYHNISVTVDEMEHNRILKLKVALLPENEEGGEDA
ncbi:MAG: HlyC/CorC family transporter [Oscillospiraceae bacterium]|nr:HlyC/CorC family transporter [Oscillospiraceae bacterium]